MACALRVQGHSPPDNLWEEVHQQISTLTLGGRSLKTICGNDPEVKIIPVRRMLSQLRARQMLLLGLLADPPVLPTEPEVACLSLQGDLELQRLREILEENNLMRAEVSQKQVLIFQKETEARLLAQEVDETQRQCDSLEQQSLGHYPANNVQEPFHEAMSEAVSEAARLRHRLDDLENNRREKEALLRQTIHEAEQEQVSKSQAVSQLEELHQEAQAVKEQKVVYATEAADCHARIGAVVTERSELGKRLSLLRQSKDQIEMASQADAAAATALRDQLAHARIERLRLEDETRRDAAELSRLQAYRPAVEEIPRRSSKPSLPASPSKQHERNDDLANELRSASAQNDFLREQLQQLAGGKMSLPQPALASPVPPETTPEVSTTPHSAHPKLDLTIDALEAQMMALAAENAALERSAAMRSS